MNYINRLKLAYPLAYLIAASAVSVISATLVSGALRLIGLSNDAHRELGGPELIAFGLFSIFFTPILETVVLVVIMRLIELTRAHKYANILISSAIAAGVHSLISPVWGLIVFVPFVIFSATYIIWRNQETSQGFKMCCAVHALHNLAPGLVSIYAGTVILASK